MGNVLDGVVVRQGGGTCDVAGGAFHAAVEVDGTLASMHRSTVRQSAGNGIEFALNAQLLDFGDNHFGDNAKASVATRVALLGATGGGNTFDAAGDTIDVTDLSALQGTVTLHKQAVPYHIAATSFQIGNGATMTIEPGTTIALAGGNFSVGGSALLLAMGTAAEPIVFTSAAATPAAGDWGCLMFQGSELGTSVVDHVAVAYGGSKACVGYKTGLLIGQYVQSLQVTASAFHDLAGNAIYSQSALCDKTGWQASDTFTATGCDPIRCSGDPVCP
jgi:hypothetical protein